MEDCIYLGDAAVEELVNIKSREELIGDIIGLLQSPAKNVISALRGSAGQKSQGWLKPSKQGDNISGRFAGGRYRKSA
ncbi:MAG: hypothetical protein ACLUEV_09330 [Alistipes sp.]